MATIQVYQFAVMDVDGRQVKAGSLSEPRCISITNDEVFDQTFKVGPETAIKVFDKTENEAMGAFSFLWMESDMDVLVQFTSDAGGTDVRDTKTLKGSGTSGQMGVALVLGSDDTQLLDGTIDTFDGTADTVDEVWVYNANATSTARVRVIAAN